MPLPVYGSSGRMEPTVNVESVQGLAERREKQKRTKSLEEIVSQIEYHSFRQVFARIPSMNCPHVASGYARNRIERTMPSIAQGRQDLPLSPPERTETVGTFS